MRPILFSWDGEVMRPYGRMSKLADEQFVVGETYMLEQVAERSQQDHRHYFAWLNEVWRNLPEHLDGKWSDVERLRKWALCATGHCQVITHTFRTRKEAEKFMAETARQDDEVFLERIRTRVIERRAKSQSYSAMTKTEFRKSKDDVINLLTKMIGVNQQEAA